MHLKDKIDLWIWGETLIEAWFLDRMLSAFQDGVPHSIPVETGQLGWDSTRARDKLIRDKFLEPRGNDFIITSDGRLHLNKGGFIAEVKHAKLSRISFFLSLIALIASLVAIGLSFINWIRS